MRKLLLLLTAVLLIMCQNERPFSATDKATVNEEVINMLHAYHAAMKNDGLMAEFDYLDQSNDFFWAPPGYHSALSYDSVKTIITGNAKAMQLVDFTWDTLQIFPLSPAIANFTGIVSGVMVDTAGTRSAVKMLESGTAIKRESGWKLLNGQTAVLD